MPHNSEPSENWDDDFEFHSNRNSRRSPDVDQDLPRPPQDSQDNDDRDETHTHRRPRASIETTTENWDDDFAEDDEPVAAAPYPNSNTTSNGSATFDLPPPPALPKSSRNRTRTPRANRVQRAGSDATQRMRVASSSTVRERSASHSSSLSGSGWGSSDDEADELGFAGGGGPDEDRTVTARSASGSSRRVGSGSYQGSSPPPPVPPLPSSAAAGPSGLALMIPTTTMQPQPFPRSPTTSVFSAPDNASIAYTHTSAGSTTALTRPHREKDKTAAKGLAGLPPSPPIHRERRRLRKKSRPGGPSGTNGSGMMEMREISARRERESSEDMDEEDWDADEAGVTQGVYSNEGASRSSIVQRLAENSQVASGSSHPYQAPTATGSQSQLSSPGLLSRIGSVKRWVLVEGRARATGRRCGRRRRGAALASRAKQVDVNSDLDVIADIHSHANEATPRPPSSSSLIRSASNSSESHSGSHSRARHSYAHPSPATPPPRPSNIRYSQITPGTPRTPPENGQRESRGWFFRGASGSPADRGRVRTGPVNGGGGGAGGGMGRDGSTETDLTGDRPYTPSPHGGESGEKEKEGKSKLVKRRSLGFVQIRRGIRPLNGGGEETTPVANSSPSKYAGLGVGRPSAAAVGSVEDLAPQKEGMGFVERNVRRISLVGAGRHRRTKSGVSISTLPVDEKDMLPPTPPVDLQLQPPSPPQTLRAVSGSMSTVKAPIASRALEGLPSTFSPPSTISLASPISLPSSSSPSLAAYSAPSSSSASNSPSPKPPVSPQTASLGRSAANIPAVVNAVAAAASPAGTGGVGTMRRNSLGDLKIPARISQAQVGLRRDLGMVREFARNVEELKELQNTRSEWRLRPFSVRTRSNTSSSNPDAPSPVAQQQAYKQLASTFYTINSKYRISWECAELLIELGGGGAASSPPSTSTSAPVMPSTGVVAMDKNKMRERAVTLTDDSKVPPPVTPTPVGPPLASLPSNLAWRASTGRNDLSQRQLLLLKEMLGSSMLGTLDDSFAADGIPEEAIAAAMVASSSNTHVNREWRWGDAMNSTVTLPSEESGVQGNAVPGKDKKRRSSRLRMSGFRDILRALTKGAAPPMPVSSTSISTESSGDLHSQHLYEHPQVPTNGRRRRAKTSAGPESLRSHHRPASPYDPSSLKTASPRRPSLASIFRLGKNKTPPSVAAADLSSGSAAAIDDLYPTFSGLSGGRESASNSTGDEEEDWDRMEDSASDLEHNSPSSVAPCGGSTIRGRSPYLQSTLLTPLPVPGRGTTPMRSPSGSRTSIHDPSGAGGPSRATRLSNVEEHAHADRPSTKKGGESPSRQFSRSRRGGKTGSVRSMPPGSALPDPKLAMTPENIKPLLENAREVQARLGDCIAEIRFLLAGVEPKSEK
ncbi:hypothetical protein FB45DRAFT_899602 [Roridomyces roridus]|uniref:Uncharacterized protein n=1 Tax=Roridomyces roridus TaxID=1738132 RepID=A0AAD7C7F7_9AGAR|nr:hypothetical protein FB45DRAFT_899602 [Roridomyces roridus]